MNYTLPVGGFKGLCQSQGFDEFDIVNEALCYLIGIYNPKGPILPMLNDFSAQKAQPLMRGMKIADIDYALREYFRRPVEMMRYPTTFIQDPIYWALFDIDWYLHNHRMLAEINRARAIYSCTKEPLHPIMVTGLYHQYVSPFSIPEYGMERDIERRLIAFDSIYTRRNGNLEAAWRLMTENAAWYTIALYQYHRAYTAHGEKGVESLIQKSALNEKFWAMIRGNYKTEFEKFHLPRDIENATYASLYYIFSLVDIEFSGEVYGHVNWLGADNKPVVHDAIPNLYGFDESVDHDYAIIFDEYRSHLIAKYKSDLIRQSQKQSKSSARLYDFYMSSRNADLEFVHMRLLHPAATEQLDFGNYFDGFYGLKCNRSYHLPEITKEQMDFAEVSVIQSVQEFVPFLSDTQYGELSRRVNQSKAAAVVE